jgi:hypothetical protein
MIAGGAAFGGVNLAMSLYLVLGTVGSIGLLVGVFTVFAKNPLFAWATGLSSAFIALLSFIFLCGFLFNREKGVPLNDPLYIAHAPFPLIALYGFAFILCASTVWLSVMRVRQAKDAGDF